MMTIYQLNRLTVNSNLLRGVLLLLLLTLLNPATTLYAAPQAQVPPTINYQGTLRDAQGNLVNGTRTMTFRFYSEIVGDTALALHTETHDISVREGVFDVVLQPPVTIYTNVELYIGITVAPDTNEMIPRQRLHPVPWAQLATSATNATNATNANTATTLTKNATVDGLIINKGATNEHALSVVSSGPGYGSGIRLQNTAGPNSIYSIYVDPDGILHFNDVKVADRVLIYPTTGEMHVMGPLKTDGNVNVTGKVLATGGFNGRCAPSPGAVGLLITCNSDVAETFGTDERTEPGDLVVFIPEDRTFPAVQLSTQPYEGDIVGVVSTDPGLVFDQGETRLSGDNSNLITDNKTVVAMVGRVPTRFTLENGPIAVGDPLTSSSTPGAAMKATQAGRIIGYAMQSSDAAEDGKLLVWLQLSMHIPAETLAALNGSTPAGSASNATIANLEAQVATLSRQIEAIQATNSSARWPLGLPLLGGLAVIGMVVGVRKRFQGGL